MSGPYQAVKTSTGCHECGTGAVWDVVGPDDIALSVSWEDYNEDGEGEEEAQTVAGWLNEAFGHGRQDKSEELDPWHDFETDPPAVECQVIVWDEELDIPSTYWWHDSSSMELVRKHRYSHWKLPPLRPESLPPKVVEAAPPVLQPPPPVITGCQKNPSCILPHNHEGDCDLDIPF
jgi:hypothetical protein